MKKSLFWLAGSNPVASAFGEYANGQRVASKAIAGKTVVGSSPMLSALVVVNLESRRMLGCRGCLENSSCVSRCGFDPHAFR